MWTSLFLSLSFTPTRLFSLLPPPSLPLSLSPPPPLPPSFPPSLSPPRSFSCSLSLSLSLSLFFSPPPSLPLSLFPSVLGHRSRVHYGVHIQSWLCSVCYCHPFSSWTGVLHTIQVNSIMYPVPGLWNVT